MSTSREACPFCGKTFKRLNSHLPKCKMTHVSKTAASNVLTHPVQKDHILDKLSKKKSSSTTSQKTKNTSTLLYSPPFSTPSSNKMKAKKASLSLPLSSSALTTTKKSKTPLSPSPLTTSSKTVKKQKHLDETLIVSKDCLPKDPDGILMKHIPTPTVKLNADSTTVAATVKKLKASSTKAKLKASPATTILPVSPKAKAASKKVSLRKQIELFTQTASAATILSQEPVTEEQGEIRPNIQNHPASTDDLTCSHLYNKTSLLDHKPTITSHLNEDRLCSKTSKQGTLSMDHSSSMVDLVQNKTSDQMYKNKGPLLISLGQNAASALNHSSVTVGMLAPQINSAKSLTMKPQKLSQTETVEVLKSIVEPSYPPLSALSFTSSHFLISPGVPNQRRDTGPQCPKFPYHQFPIPSLPLSPSVSPLPCSALSPILCPWIPTREVVGMEVMLEMTMPYQMIGLKQTFSPCSCTWHILVGMMLHVSTWFTPFLKRSPPNPPPSHPPTLSGPPLPFLSPSLPVCTERAKLATANDSRTLERAQLNGRKYGTEPRIIGALTLGEVRLKELPGWIATQTFHNPRQRAQALPRSWRWYYRTYVDVKGGVGRMAMLLAGYCFFSYTWSNSTAIAGECTTKAMLSPGRRSQSKGKDVTEGTCPY